MKVIEKSVLLTHSAAQMYGLVTDVASYPQFLPWCSDGVVLQTHDDGVTAKVGMSLAGFQHAFVTRNVQVANERLEMALVDGPFSHLDGRWVFRDLGTPEEPACKVTFDLTYDFSSPLLARVVGPIFDKIATSLIDAFVQRADALYGDRL
jgi:ribosome-associated toxin RatA of RatAB toxin-antitoxin module